MDMLGDTRTDSQRSRPLGASCGICALDLNMETTAGLRQMGRRWYHNECINARRCLERMMGKDEELREVLKRMQFEDPAKYNGIVLSLRSAPGARNSSTRSNTRHFISEMCAETAVSRKSSVLLLGRRQFVAWYVHNELMEREEAEKKWEEDCLAPDVQKEEEDGEVRLAVKMPTEIAGAESFAKRRRIASSVAVDDEAQHRALVSQLRSSGSGTTIHDHSFLQLGSAALQQGAASHSTDPDGEVTPRSVAVARGPSIFNIGTIDFPSPASQATPRTPLTRRERPDLALLARRSGGKVGVGDSRSDLDDAKSHVSDMAASAVHGTENPERLAQRTVRGEHIFVVVRSNGETDSARLSSLERRIWLEIKQSRSLREISRFRCSEVNRLRFGWCGIQRTGS